MPAGAKRAARPGSEYHRGQADRPRSIVGPLIAFHEDEAARLCGEESPIYHLPEWPQEGPRLPREEAIPPALLLQGRQPPLLVLALLLGPRGP